MSSQASETGQQDLDQKNQ
jgi:chromosome segregation ATPase